MNDEELPTITLFETTSGVWSWELRRDGVVIRQPPRETTDGGAAHITYTTLTFAYEAALIALQMIVRAEHRNRGYLSRLGAWLREF